MICRNGHDTDVVGTYLGYCRECKRAARRAWRARNVERERARARAWHHANRKRVAERMRAWKVANPERTRAYRTQRRALLKAATDESAVQWRIVIAGDPCAYCGGPGETDDHIVPLSAGGLDSADNLVRACSACNDSKWNRPLLLWLHQQVAALGRGELRELVSDD